MKNSTLATLILLTTLASCITVSHKETKESSRHYTANEYILISEIKNALEIFTQMLDGLRI